MASPTPGSERPKATALGSNQSTAAASSLALVGAVITTAANFVIAFIVSRASIELAGVFWSSTAIVAILGNAGSLGTMTGLVYFMPQAIAGERPDPRALIRLALGPVAALGLVLGTGVFASAGPVGEWIAEESASDLTAMLRVLAVAIPCWGLTQCLLGASRGLGTMGPTVLINQVLRPGGQILLIGLLFVVDGSPSAAWIALAWGAPVLIGLVVAAIAVVRLGGWQHNGRAAVSRAEFWAYTRFRALSTALQIALERIDVIVISALLGPGPAGAYGSLSRYIAAGNFLIFSVAQAMSAHLRKAIANDNLVRAATLLKRTTGWIVLVAWPYFLLVATKAEPLAGLLNADYRADAEILPILALGMMVSAAAGPIDLMLLMFGRSKASLVGIALAIATDLVLLVALTPSLGLVGAALAWSAGVVVQNVLASVLVRRDSGISQIDEPLFLAAGISLVAVVPVGLLLPDTLAGLVGAGAVAGVILLAFALRHKTRLGLSELIPARIFNRLPGS